MRYYGGKQKLLTFISESVDSVLGGGRAVVGDAFAGTGVVSQRLKEEGYQVSANDLMYFSACLNVENLNFSSSNEWTDRPSEKFAADLLAHLQGVKGVHGIVTESFSPAGSDGRMYFSPQNAMLIDALRLEIAKLKESGTIEGEWEEFAISRLLRAINQVSNVTGTFAAFMKSWDSRALKPLEYTFAEKSLVRKEFRSRIFNGDIFDYLQIEPLDLVYLDPPYNSRDYSTNYGILEYIALGFPSENCPSGVTGAVKFPDKKSECTSKRTVASAFERMFKVIQCDHVILSYNNEGLLGRDALYAILESFGNVEIRERRHKRFRSINQDGTHVETVESLYLVSR